MTGFQSVTLEEGKYIISVREWVCQERVYSSKHTEMSNGNWELYKCRDMKDDISKNCFGAVMVTKCNL